MFPFGNDLLNDSGIGKAEFRPGFVSGECALSFFVHTEVFGVTLVVPVSPFGEGVSVTGTGDTALTLAEKKDFDIFSKGLFLFKSFVKLLGSIHIGLEGGRGTVSPDVAPFERGRPAERLIVLERDLFDRSYGDPFISGEEPFGIEFIFKEGIHC